jgi:hypothetical protein
MPQYLLNIIQPDGPPPSPEQLEAIMARLAALRQDMKDAGAFVFTGGLHPASSATVVRATENGAPVTTDGPYAEAKEHVGGFWILTAPDLDDALAWARRAGEATTLPIEVRPFSHAESA